MPIRPGRLGKVALSTNYVYSIRIGLRSMTLSRFHCLWWLIMMFRCWFMSPWSLLSVNIRFEWQNKEKTTTGMCSLTLICTYSVACRIHEIGMPYGLKCQLISWRSPSKNCCKCFCDSTRRRNLDLQCDLDMPSRLIRDITSIHLFKAAANDLYELDRCHCAVGK